MNFIKQSQEQFSKETFLTEHNRLSPIDLQVTSELLTRFQEERKPLLKDADWSFKLRVPLISWLLALPHLALPPEKKKYVRKSKKSVFKTYPHAEG